MTFARLPEGGIQPQLVADASGNLHALYFKGEPAHGDVVYARVDQSGRVGTPVQVNRQPGVALATGSVRGPHLALGRDDRVHVAWIGSNVAKTKAAGGRTPVLYTRMDGSGAAFEPERSVLQFTEGVDGAAVAADSSGHVYVAWHGAAPGVTEEARRRIWIARSTDDGGTFAKEASASPPATGACGCCGVAALANREGSLFVLYRGAREMVHRDAFVLTSRDHGAVFAGDMLQEWKLGACPMSTFNLTESPDAVVAAWETGGQVQWLRIDPRTGAKSAVIAAPNAATNRKHPAVARNAKGETMLVWAENTGWNKGGALAWQLYDRNDQPTAEHGQRAGVPVWGLVAVAARPDGSFIVLY
jgi:hypothetical protein